MSKPKPSPEEKNEQRQLNKVWSRFIQAMKKKGALLQYEASAAPTKKQQELFT